MLFSPSFVVPFHLLLGSTSWCLPALAYASDRHVTDVFRVMYYVRPVQFYVCSVSVIDLIRTFRGILSGL